MPSLSERFDQMAAQRVIVKPVHNMGATQRRVDVDSRRKVGRQTQFDARRQGVMNAKPAMRQAQSKMVSPRQQPQQQQQQQQRAQGRGRGRNQNQNQNQNQKTMAPRAGLQKTAGRGGSANGRGPGRGAGRTGGRGNNAAGGRGGGRGGHGGRGGRGGRGNTKKEAAKPVDLDEGLDEYWFKAGKGPDPKVASLDRGLDSYWSKAAEKTNGDAAAGDKMEDEAPDAAAPAVAPVAGVDPEL
eukprot:g5496.t2